MVTVGALEDRLRESGLFPSQFWLNPFNNLRWWVWLNLESMEPVVLLINCNKWSNAIVSKRAKKEISSTEVI